MARSRQSGSGGSRQGTPGKRYPNRSDLRAKKPLVPATPPSPTYGAGASSLRSQTLLPLGPPGSTAPQPAMPAGPGQPNAGAPIQPGMLGDIMRPTDHPNEPITAGSPSGPGPGPTSAGLRPEYPDNAQGLILSLAQGPNANPVLRDLANYIASGRA